MTTTPAVRVLTNGGFRLALETAAPQAGLAQRLADFLHPFFVEDTAPSEREPDLTVALHDLSTFPRATRAACRLPLRIRESHAPGFTLTVRLSEQDGTERLAWDDEANVGYRIDAAARRVDFHSGDSGFVHLIELVRYYGLRVEQARGACVMHASAVVDDATGLVTAIGGPKGAGKTTTMMALVAEGGQRYFSGDKLLLEVRDGQIVARGWPDFPYVGAGTLRAWPDWAARLGLAAAAADPDVAMRRKFLVDPRDFKRAMPFTQAGHGVLGRILLPDVDYAGAPRATNLDPAEVQRSLVMTGLFEWPSDFLIGRWHGLVPRGGDAPATLAPEISRRLAALPWVRRDGAMALPA